MSTATNREWRSTGSHWLINPVSKEKKCCHCGPANVFTGPQFVCTCDRSTGEWVITPNPMR